MPSSEPAKDTQRPPSFPSPQIFSLIPSVHALLLRLQAGALENGPSPTDGTDPSEKPQPLLLKDFPSAAAPIRLKIAKAKATVEGIPDIERTVEEQEGEIRELEERVQGLKRMLGKLSDDENK